MTDVAMNINQDSISDLFDDELPKELSQSIPILIKNSLKRTFNMFAGNAGLRTIKSLEITEPRRKRIKTKIHDEYSCLPEAMNVISISQSHKPLLYQQSESVSETQLAITSSSISKIHGPSLLPLVDKHTLMPLQQTPGTSSTALQHLAFRRTPRIPKAAEHPNWELMRVISGHQGWVRTLAVDPSNEWFASGGNDRIIKIWDLATGTLKLSLTGHVNTIRGLEVSTRHPYLFSCGEDQMVKCWDLEYNKVIRNYHGHLSGVYSIALHPTLDILSTGGRDAVVRVWDARLKKEVHVLSGHSGCVMSLVSQRFEPQLISGSLDKMIRCWDLAAGKSSVVLTHHKKAIRGLAIHPREYTFCSAGADHLKIWKCPKASFERNLEAVGSIMNSICIRDDPENSIAIGGSDQGHIHFWDWNTGQKFQTIETIPQPGSLSSEKAIYCCKLDMSETRLLTAECDKTIKVWREQSSAI